MPTPHIRRAIPDDGDTLTALTNAAYEKYIPLLGRPPQPLTTTAKWSLTTPSGCWNWTVTPPDCTTRITG